ncbi:uncharacterized protein LOC109859250 [Pseudomyrmex gracilis]|uniref:uncharacterized protein LOC109859250 n=1 Tax=Pseudomyrmex gracilis TaxID=219809 RepID=UPI0009954DB5|nr:uncharacterized protein LOC109859250 [Pseudomyrmex gracilis]
MNVKVEECNNSKRDKKDVTKKNIIENIIKQITPQDYGLLVYSEDSGIKITGQKICQCLNNLYEIREVTSPTLAQTYLVEVLVHSVKYEEVKQFLYKYKFLTLVRHLLLNKPTPFCKDKVVEILSILCQVKVNQTKPDYVVEMIERIGKDHKLVNELTFCLKNDQIKSLVKHTLEFLYSAALVVKMRPTSKWIVYFKSGTFIYSIIYLMRIYDKVHLLTLILAILVILSETISTEASSHNSLVLKDIFNMQELIRILYNMKYFRTINYDPARHLEFYYNWLTLVNNIKQKNLFVFDFSNLHHVRNIYGHVETILDFFEKALRMIIKSDTKQFTAMLLKLLNHTIVVEKCMILATEFKKCKIPLLTNLQITCGIEQKFLTIRVLLDVIEDNLLFKLENLDGDILFEAVSDDVYNLAESLNRYFDDVIREHSNDYYALYNILYQWIENERNRTVTQDQILPQNPIVTQVQVIEYLHQVEAYISYITENVRNNPLSRILDAALNAVKKTIEE